jgi:hypothetical protein
LVPQSELNPRVSFLVGLPESDGDAVAVDVLLIDGNRNGDYVLFDHEGHTFELSEENDPRTSCVSCHHMNKPLDTSTGCSECHTDMYLAADIFDHDFHREELGGNAGCVECHFNSSLPKLRENTTDCLECHSGIRAEGSRVEITDPAKQYRASGYMTAMHELCIGCHEERQPTLMIPNENFSRCSHCHQALPDLDDEVWNRTAVSTATRSPSGIRKPGAGP